MGRLGTFVLVAVLVFLSGCGSAGKRNAVVSTPAPPPVPEAPPPPSSQAQAQPPATPVRDEVDLLISEAESLHASGVEDYRAGDFTSAKERFDRALAVLLESKFDLASDERLRAAFDRLVEDIHGLEVAALENGNGLTQQKYEPAPIDSFADLTFPVDPKVQERAAQELKSVHSDLPLVSNEYVDGVLTYFQSRGRGFIENVLKRSGHYQPVITEALKREGLPQDLIYMAGAESGFNPFALSRKGAKGIWQLMLSRAVEYGLRKDRWVDEREDPVKSTEAAVRHLKDLYQMFGDWHLAMAAYNCGPANVQRAIEKTGYADFWMLRKLEALPTETLNYVPIVLATALAAKDPLRYGIEVQPEPPFGTDRAVVSTPTDLRLAAEIVDQPVEEIIRLNPGLLRWTTPPNDPNYVLNLPPGTGAIFEQAVARIPPDKRIWWRTHKVGNGDTLASVAKKFRVTTVALAQANHLERDTVLEEGARLVVPMSPGKEASLSRARAPGPRRLYRYRVRPGDTLERIADLYDVTPYQIRRWNRMRGSRLVAGKTLKLYVAGGPVRRSRNQRLRRSNATSSKPSTGKSTASAPASHAAGS